MTVRGMSEKNSVVWKKYNLETCPAWWTVNSKEVTLVTELANHNEPTI